MTKEPHPDGKILIVGGGIANFTNVASTFKGIIRALGDFAPLIKVGTSLACRQALACLPDSGPNRLKTSRSSCVAAGPTTKRA